MAILKSKLDRQIDRLDRGLPQTGVEGGLRSTVFEWQQKFSRLVKKCPWASCQQFYEQQILNDFIDGYHLWRARKIGADRVLLELEEINKMRGFFDEEVIANVQKQYQKWLANSQDRLHAFEQENQHLVESIQYVLGSTASVRLEHKLLLELHEKGLITENVFANLAQYFDELSFLKHRQDVLRYYAIFK